MSAELRVLYAEDDHVDADLTKGHFARAAPDVVLEVVDSGGQCLARLAQGTYDALLLDHHLPDMDGVAVLRERAAREMRLPVVMVTGVGDETLVVQVLGLGAYDYVPKHRNYLDDLPAVLRRAVIEHRSLLPWHHAHERQRRRILYGEYSSADIDLTLTYLAEAAPHFRVEVARSSADALARLQNDHFDLVLTELRNPLAPIRTALALLRRGGSHDDLLDVARITNGRITLAVQDVDLREIVREATDSVRGLIDARHHRLQTSLPPDPVRIRGDVTRLVQVVVNLLNNAAKYTDEGGIIRVDVSAVTEQAVLRVSDTGTGISARLLPKIFDLFTQDDRTLDRAQGGWVSG